MSPSQPKRRSVLASVALGELAATLRSGIYPLIPLAELPEPIPAPGRDQPVLLVHGYMAHREVLRPLARHLLNAGFSRVHRVGYPSMALPFEGVVAAIADAARPLAARHGKVHLVGHSLGALASRAWIKLFGGHHIVDRFVSLGGPHGGTALHRVVPSPVRPAFDPDGPWIRRINEGPEPVPTFVIRARYDHQVFPPERAQIRGTDEIVVEAHGHNGLLWSPQAHAAVAHALTRPIG